jgi:hypothetical protein
MLDRGLLVLGAAVSATFLAVLAAACGGGGSPAGATPTPAPPVADGGSGGCRLGEGSTTAACSRGSSRLAGHVLGAMDRLLAERPQLFDRTQASPSDSDNYRVLDKDAFIDGMVAMLQSQGLCAQRDPDDYALEQIQVKNENGFSENFDVLLGDGYMWHNGASYRATCVPASFPVERSSDLPPVGSGCGRPYPPPLREISVKVHIDRGQFWVLDSTPLVGVDAAYCLSAGFTDGRSICAVRPEGSPERASCENWRMGVAEDTGRPGPTWRRNGALCTGGASGCENEPSNQYLLIATLPGTYTACARTGLCGTLQLRR